MARIKGIKVILLDKIKEGEDPFGHPIYKDVEIQVDNVLVSPTSTDDVLNTLNLTGRTATYTLAIPKNDTNIWTDRKVKFFNRTWRTFGVPEEGIDELVPLDWNKKVKVEIYE